MKLTGYAFILLFSLVLAFCSGVLTGRRTTKEALIEADVHNTLLRIDARVETIQKGTFAIVAALTVVCDTLAAQIEGEAPSSATITVESLPPLPILAEAIVPPEKVSE